MDIDLLSKMVKELILDNDRVTLPGLGSFVAEIVPSTFTDRGYTINPPYRRLYFRSKPDEGDILVNFYAETNNLEYVMAERIMRDFISELKSVLHTKKTVIFPGLGRLRATKENNVFFVADEDLDIYPAGFGLEPISLKTHEETPQEVTAAVEELKVIMDEPVAEEVVEEGPIDISLDDEFVPLDWEDEEPQKQEPELQEDEQHDDEPQEQDDSVIPEEIEPTPAENTSEPLMDEEPETVESAEEDEPYFEEDTAAEVELPAETELPSEDEVSAETEMSTETDVPVKKEEPAVKAAAEQEDIWKKVLKVIAAVLACLVALLVIYMVAMRLFPDFLNGILYTPEELEIINFR